MAVFRSSQVRMPVTFDAVEARVGHPEVATTGATDGSTTTVTPERSALAVAFGLLVAGVVVGWLLTRAHKPGPFTPTPGISVFALFYAVAQAIERLQEPFTPWLGRTSAPGPGNAARRTVVQGQARASRDALVLEAVKAPGDEDKARTAAKAQRTVDQIRANMTVLLWGSSSFLAMVASGYFGLYFLRAIGVRDPGVALDIAITGLAIGGGTKPLHDLITNIKEAKEARQDPPETT